ncbi:MAG: energy-coupled thiamine transporter ThiT, partial [Clostridiales bacterium]|nr:energy-coupled thiamine transporter ThiT [Clostridiales bacterium]
MNKNTKKLVGIGLFTAIVVVLQLLGSFIKFGTFSISLVLIPIVVGTALYGIGAGAWLGLAFGVTVLISGDAAAFLTVNVIGTIV